MARKVETNSNQMSTMHASCTQEEGKKMKIQKCQVTQSNSQWQRKWKNSKTRQQNSCFRGSSKIIKKGCSSFELLLAECCFTSTVSVGLLGTGAQDGHLNFHTAPGLLTLFRVNVAFFQQQVLKK